MNERPPRLVRVTLVPVNSLFKSLGPFECLEFRAFPSTFYHTTADGEAAEPIDMYGKAYCAIGEAIEEP